MTINLPTYEQQQDIKQDTSEILNQFPISAGTDFSQLNTFIQLHSESSSPSGSSIIEVSGSGYLCFIGATGQQTGLTIDGQYKGLISTNVVTYFNMLRFESGFKLQWFGSTTASRPAIVYILD